MLLYLNKDKINELNSHTIFITIIQYIASIAALKFIEHKHTMHGFFNIYIILIILLDFGFTLYNFIKYNFLNVSIEIKKKDFNTFPDEIINCNFDIKKLQNELINFDKEIRKKIIKKENITETEIKKFNEQVKV
jgi:hypothetical protein